jgi:hypothetical protein
MTTADRQRKGIEDGQDATAAFSQRLFGIRVHSPGINVAALHRRTGMCGLAQS